MKAGFNPPAPRTWRGLVRPDPIFEQSVGVLDHCAVVEDLAAPLSPVRAPGSLRASEIDQPLGLGTARADQLGASSLEPAVQLDVASADHSLTAVHIVLATMLCQGVQQPRADAPMLPPIGDNQSEVGFPRTLKEVPAETDYLAAGLERHELFVALVVDLDEPTDLPRAAVVPAQKPLASRLLSETFKKFLQRACVARFDRTNLDVLT
jgi:hypothetical protein